MGIYLIVHPAIIFTFTDCSGIARSAVTDVYDRIHAKSLLRKFLKLTGVDCFNVKQMWK